MACSEVMDKERPLEATLAIYFTGQIVENLRKKRVKATNKLHIFVGRNDP